MGFNVMTNNINLLIFDEITDLAIEKYELLHQPPINTKRLNTINIKLLALKALLNKD